MTNDTVQKRIDELEAECVTLKTKHEETVKQFQQIVTQNQNRYAFLQGSITELKKLNNEEGTTNGDHELNVLPRRTRGRPRRTNVPDVVN